jgi:hypothetical protein
LVLKPSCVGYISRGKLLVSSSKFYLGYMDFEEADNIYKERDEARLISSSAKNSSALVDTEESLDQETTSFL